jgi:ATP-dependent RNA helicase RhlE
MLKGVRATGHLEPTPLQSKAIPLILEGNDVVVLAQSGSGKTGSFLIPILTRLVDGAATLSALVVTPTRERAAQIETLARGYARFTSLRIGVAYVGVAIAAQEKTLREVGADLLVATPGRLLELHARGVVSFDNVETLVLDEGDRMVDMGMATDVRRLLKLMPETRQSLLFSATIPPELNRLVKEALLDPIRVDLNAPSRPLGGITQAIYPVPRHLKSGLLHQILSRHEVSGVIVFTRTKQGAERLLRELQQHGHSVAGLHESRSQAQRERALADLRRGRVQILVATDIASRGIEVSGIAHVVNYDVPPTPEDYVHRLGRTGQGEAVGDTATLMSPEEQKDVAGIEHFLGRAVPRVMLPDFDYEMRPAEIKHVPGFGDHPAQPDAASETLPRPAKRPGAAATPGTSRKPAAARPGSAPSRPSRAANRPPRPRPGHSRQGASSRSAVRFASHRPAARKRH